MSNSNAFYIYSYEKMDYRIPRFHTKFHKSETSVNIIILFRIFKKKQVVNNI